MFKIKQSWLQLDLASLLPFDLLYLVPFFNFNVLLRFSRFLKVNSMCIRPEQMLAWSVFGQSLFFSLILSGSNVLGVFQSNGSSCEQFALHSVTIISLCLYNHLFRKFCIFMCLMTSCLELRVHWRTCCSWFMSRVVVITWCRRMKVSERMSGCTAAKALRKISKWLRFASKCLSKWPFHPLQLHPVYVPRHQNSHLNRKQPQTSEPIGMALHDCLLVVRRVCVCSPDWSDSRYLPSSERGAHAVPRDGGQDDAVHEDDERSRESSKQSSNLVWLQLETTENTE